MYFQKGKKKQKLGTILRRLNFITKNQLKQAIDIQKRNGKSLGRILVNLNYITVWELQLAIKEQNKHIVKKREHKEEVRYFYVMLILALIFLATFLLI
jgi:hypothetical protein